MITEPKILESIIVSLDLSSEFLQAGILFKMLVTQQETPIEIDHLIKGELVFGRRFVKPSSCSNNLLFHTVSRSHCLAIQSLPLSLPLTRRVS